MKEVYVITSEPGPVCEFVEIEDSEGRSVNAAPTEPYPGKPMLYRIGPLFTLSPDEVEALGAAGFPMDE